MAYFRLYEKLKEEDVYKNETQYVYKYGGQHNLYGSKFCMVDMNILAYDGKTKPLRFIPCAGRKNDKRFKSRGEEEMEQEDDDGNKAPKKTPAKKKRTRRQPKCKTCGEIGHNSRSCKKRKKAPVVPPPVDGEFCGVIANTEVAGTAGVTDVPMINNTVPSDGTDVPAGGPPDVAPAATAVASVAATGSNNKPKAPLDELAALFEAEGGMEMDDDSASVKAPASWHSD